jgi:uncharacterized FAD-dependent dehydrogenase
MLRINIKLPVGTPEELSKKVASRLGIGEDAFTLIPRKRSVDAREAPTFVWTADLSFRDPNAEKSMLKKHGKLLSVAPEETPYTFPVPASLPKTRPIVVGFGPAGIFCGLMLARSGFRPIVLERGSSMTHRVEAVDTFFREGTLQTECNLQFGEGGAGAFSDGKLNTLVKDKSFRGYFALEQLVKAGAPEELLWLNKPHVGTDLLREVIVNLRQEIFSLGGEVRFDTKVEELLTEDGSVKGVRLADGTCIESDRVVLAIGHSARDTFRMLREKGVPMEKKPFSVGVRIEHPREMIDKAQYGPFACHPRLGAANYKLACHPEHGRGAYTFCMCPGGTVVAAASEEGHVVVNGMSEYARDKENANCALLVGIEPPFDSDHPLAGMYLQREIEKKAFIEGGGNYTAPAQLLGDFLKNEPTKKFGFVNPSCPTGVAPSDLRRILPHKVTETIAGAINDFDKKLNGFNLYDAVLTAPESRSSSPIRILRNEFFQTTKVQGVFPSGEGAGYAGGIVSAAVDGIKCAEAIISDLR